MYKTLIILFVLTILSCQQSQPPTKSESQLTNNKELIEIYTADQADRKTANIDWSVVSKRDEQRRKRVNELLDSNLVKTSDDYANAAMVFQHGPGIESSEMAVKLMRKAVELDPHRSKWLLAAAIDRDLMRKDKPQIYGTQYQRAGKDEPYVQYTVDTTKVTDAERIEYRVGTLAKQKEKLRLMNTKKLNELLKEGKSIDEVIQLAKETDIKNSKYNLSEMGVNMLGYELMNDGKEQDALKIFKLNIDLYPSNYNTYDSYGGCLMKLGKTKEGIAAYKKSLELNPKNDNAISVLKKLENPSKE